MTQTPPILDATLTRPDLLPALVPTWLLALACGILFCLWMGVRRSVKPRGFLVRYALAMPVASATAFLLFQTIARVIWLAGAWPLWVAAALSGGVLELVLLAYERECSVLRAPIRRMLMACRLLAILVALMMLLQPVYVTEQTRRIQRRVAVLLDESASMWRVDTQWRLNEVLDGASRQFAKRLRHIQHFVEPPPASPTTRDTLYAAQVSAISSTALTGFVPG